jgi:hypothetical protein
VTYSASKNVRQDSQVQASEQLRRTDQHYLTSPSGTTPQNPTATDLTKRKKPFCGDKLHFSAGAAYFNRFASTGTETGNRKPETG